MKQREMRFCAGTLNNRISEGSVPVFATSKFVRKYGGTKLARELSSRAAEGLAGEGEHRLSAIFHLYSGERGKAAAQMELAGLLYPAIYHFTLCGDYRSARRLADTLLRPGEEAEEFFSRMDMRIKEARHLMHSGQYAEALPYLLSFMSVGEALHCSESMEESRPYRAIDVYANIGMLHRSLELLASRIKAADPSPFSDPELEAHQLSARALSDQCARNVLPRESFEFQVRANDYLTLLGEGTEVAGDGAFYNSLSAARQAAGNGDREFALECGRKLESSGLFLSAAKLYGEMGQPSLEALNLVLAGEFERAYWMGIEKNARAREV